MVDAKSLIDEVKARPGLYDKSLPEYAKKTMKESLWMELTETLIEDWEDLSEVERSVKCKKLQFKWKHIRDNFRRELLAQKRKTGGRIKAKYKYYDRLSFLTAHVSPFNEDEKQSHDGEETDEDEKVETQIIIAEDLDSPPTTVRPPPRNTYARHKGNTTNSVTPSIIRQRRKKKQTTEEEILKVLKSKDQLEADEDRTFCLSLVSSLKKMCDGTKLNAKIDILKIIRQYTIPQPYDSPAHSIEESLMDMKHLI